MKKPLFLYLVPFLVFVATLFFPQDWYLVKSIIGLPVIFFVPYYVATFAAFLFKKDFSKLAPVIRIPLFWIVGLLILMLFLYVFQSFGYFNFLIIISLLYICSGFQFVFSRTVVKKNNFSQTKASSLIPIFLLIGLAVCISLYFRSFSTFPLQSGNDNIFLSGLSQEILSNDFTNSNFYVYSYLPFIPVILSITSVIAHVEPIHVLWLTPFLLYSVFAFSMYFFLKSKATNSCWLAFFTTVVFLFIFGYQGRIYDLINFREKNLFFVLIPFFYLLIDYLKDRLSEKSSKSQIVLFLNFIGFGSVLSFLILVLHLSYAFLLPLLVSLLILYYLFSNSSNKHENLLVALLATCLILLHAYTGVFTVLVLSIILLSPVLKDNKILASYFAIILFIITISFAILFISANIPDILHHSADSNNIFLGGQYNYNFSSKFDMMASTYPLVLMGTGFLGAMFIFYKKVSSLYPYVLSFIATLILIYLPINFAYRLLELLAPLLALLVFYAFINLRSLFNSSVSYVLKYSYILLIGAALVFVVPDATSYVNWLYANNYASKDVGLTNFTRSEYKASLWIKSHYLSDTYIFTSPELTRSITALSGRTTMLRQKTIEYQYHVFYTLPGEGSHCKQVLLNNYGLSTSNIVIENKRVSFLIDTIDNKFLPDKNNEIELLNCSNLEVPSILISFGGKTEEISASADTEAAVFRFQNKKEAKKNYLVTIFDGVSDLRELRRKIFSSIDAKQAYEASLALTRYYDEFSKNHQVNSGTTKTLIFVSGQASLWAGDTNENQKFAAPFEDFDGFSKFFDKKYFKEVYHIDKQVYIFEVIN